MTDDHGVFTAPLDLLLPLVPFPLAFLSCGEIDTKSHYSDPAVNPNLLTTPPCLTLVRKCICSKKIMLQCYCLNPHSDEHINHKHTI